MLTELLKKQRSGKVGHMVSGDYHVTSSPSLAGLLSIKKHFYFEDPAVAAMSLSEVEEFR